VEIKLAVLGLGIGARHAESFSKLDEVELVAVVDPNRDARKAAAQQYGTRAFESTEDLLSSGIAVNAAVVASPPEAHAADIERLTERELAILCEKPLATDLENGMRIARAARRANVFFATGFCFRLEKPLEELGEKIADGVLGDVVHFRNRFGFSYDPAGTWKVRSARGGGIIRESMAHSVDLFHWLAGPIESLAATTQRIRPDRDIDEAALVCVRGRNGVTGTIEGTWLAPGSANVLTLDGTRGTAQYELATGQVHLITDRGAEVLATRDGEERFDRQARAFAAALRGEPPRTASLDDGLRALEVAKSILEADASRAWVAVKYSGTQKRRG